jgi:hypothetical protein
MKGTDSSRCSAGWAILDVMLLGHWLWFRPAMNPVNGENGEDNKEVENLHVRLSLILSNKKMNQDYQMFITKNHYHDALFS